MGYAWAAGATVAATLVALGLDAYFHVVNVALVYLLAVVLVALRFRRGPVVAVSVLNVAAFNFFFIPPRGTFHVDDPQYLLASFALELDIKNIETVRRSDSRCQLPNPVQRGLTSSHYTPPAGRSFGTAPRT